MLIAIEDYIFYGMALITFFSLIIAAGVYTMIKNNCPDAFDHWKAKRNGDVICRVHFKGRKCVDYIAEIDKAEKEIGTPYWTVPRIGIKFKPEPGDIEFIEGTIPCVNYYEDMPEAIKLNQVVAFSQLKDYFRSIGMPIEGVEHVAFYAASEYENTPLKGSNISAEQRAILNSKINSEETRKHIQRFLKVIEKHREELETMKLHSGVFTYQTAMGAVNGVIAYTSSHIAHMKETIRAALLRSEENKRKDYIMYAIVAFILCIGAASLIVVTN